MDSLLKAEVADSFVRAYPCDHRDELEFFGVVSGVWSLEDDDGTIRTLPEQSKQTRLHEESIDRNMLLSELVEQHCAAIARALAGKAL
jgi:hypothetical protein